MLAVVSLVGAPARTQSTSDDTSLVGQRIAPFLLPDQSGELVGFADYLTTDVVVLYTMGTWCPISNLYMPEMSRLQERYGEQGLQILGINSDAGVNQEDVAKHVEDYSVAFPVLMDRGQRIANMIGATRTAEAFVLDGQRIVRYHGRVNDRFGYTYKKVTATRDDLEQAIVEVLANRQVSIPTTPPLGCVIPSINNPDNVGITYTTDVAPIIQNSCQICHRPDEAAPFSLMTYEDVRDRAARIREVLVRRQMPPWHADPRYGHFSSDSSLTPEEIDKLVAWIDSGAPRGDPNELPPPREFVDGWGIDTPDLVYYLPEETTVPADGLVPYRQFTVSLNSEEDLWINQLEARPDNRAVVHHMSVAWTMPRRDATNPSSQQGYLVGSGSGQLPVVFPTGTAAKIPAGADLTVTVHYSPTGKVEKDRSYVGFVLHKGKTPPDRIAKTGVVAQLGLAIPPHERDYRAEATFTFPEDSLLLSLQPLMHVRGKNYRYAAVYPDGRRELLLLVPQWDFKWQNTYRLVDPKLMPAGTKLESVAHFGNSTDNPNNPNPNETVRSGDQIWEEAMVGYFNYSTATKPIRKRKK